MSKMKETTVITAAETIQNGFSLISNEKLLRLYATMLKCRMIHERVRILIKQKAASGRGLAAQNASLGMEAATVGVTLDLLPEDALLPHPGDYIPFFIRGLEVRALLNTLLEPSTAKTTPSAQLKLATDAAMLNKVSGNKKIAVVISNRDTNAGPWLKSLAYAEAHDLPILFLSWNHTPQKKAHRIPAVTVDGNDVVAVYRVASEAIAHARIANGPTLIECRTDASHHEDPIENMEKYLRRKGKFSEEWKRAEGARFKKELDKAAARA
jgi:pyruvate dehydrogenase E1 component alpha subunit